MIRLSFKKRQGRIAVLTVHRQECVPMLADTELRVRSIQAHNCKHERRLDVNYLSLRVLQQVSTGTQALLNLERVPQHTVEHVDEFRHY